MMLHWLTALLVLVLFGTAFVWNFFLPRDLYWEPPCSRSTSHSDPVFSLILARLIWRLSASRRPRAYRPRRHSLPGHVRGSLRPAPCPDRLGFAQRWMEGEAISFFGLFSVPVLSASTRASSTLSDDFTTGAAGPSSSCRLATPAQPSCTTMSSKTERLDACSLCDRSHWQGARPARAGDGCSLSGRPSHEHESLVPYAGAPAKRSLRVASRTPGLDGEASEAEARLHQLLLPDFCLEQA